MSWKREFRCLANRSSNQTMIIRDIVSVFLFLISNWSKPPASTEMRAGFLGSLWALPRKDHHTQFFYNGSSDSVPPGAGAVVDTKIFHPKNNDFYMWGYAGIIGKSLNLEGSSSTGKTLKRKHIFEFITPTQFFSFVLTKWISLSCFLF